MKENIDLEALLAQANQKLAEKAQEKAQTETAATTQSPEGDLTKHEGAIAEEKTAHIELQKLSAAAAKARESVEFGEKDVAAVDAVADTLRAAGMEEQLQDLYTQKQGDLEKKKQALLETEGALAAAEGQITQAQNTAAEIVPPTVSETVTPEQQAARGALEVEAKTEDRFSEIKKSTERFRSEMVPAIQTKLAMYESLSDDVNHESNGSMQAYEDLVSLVERAKSEVERQSLLTGVDDWNDTDIGKDLQSIGESSGRVQTIIDGMHRANSKDFSKYTSLKTLENRDVKELIRLFGNDGMAEEIYPKVIRQNENAVFYEDGSYSSVARKFDGENFTDDEWEKIYKLSMKARILRLRIEQLPEDRGEFSGQRLHLKKLLLKVENEISTAKMGIAGDVRQAESVVSPTVESESMVTPAQDAESTPPTSVKAEAQTVTNESSRVDDVDKAEEIAYSAKYERDRAAGIRSGDIASTNEKADRQDSKAQAIEEESTYYYDTREKARKMGIGELKRAMELADQQNKALSEKSGNYGIKYHHYEYEHAKLDGVSIALHDEIKRRGIGYDKKGAYLWPQELS